MSKPKKSIQETVQKEMPEFAAEVASLSVDQMNARIAELAKNNEIIQDTRDNDPELAEAQATLSTLGAPYREGKKAIRLKSRYLIALINEKGGE